MPRVPKCRTTPGSSRGSPFHLVFSALNSRLRLDLVSLAFSLRRRVASRLRVPLWVFLVLGLEGSEGSEFPYEAFRDTLRWICARHSYPQQTLLKPEGGYLRGSPPRLVEAVQKVVF